MATSSILGGQNAPQDASGRDVDALGPSDSSDSGSDVQGERAMPTGADNPGELGSLPVDLRSDSDSMGTGERGSATGSDPAIGADIMPDRLVGGSSPDPLDDALDIDALPEVDELATDDDVDENDEDALNG